MSVQNFFLGFFDEKLKTREAPDTDLPDTGRISPDFRLTIQISNKFNVIKVAFTINIILWLYKKQHSLLKN
jgi:hypothetical protein